MTATFFLVRHASHDLLGRVLAGRLPGVSLNGAGRDEAERLAEHLGTKALTALHSSPQPRATETAAAIARRTGLQVEIVADLDEIDFGEWTGKPFDLLRDDPRFERWNEQRGTGRAPAGETMAAAQSRIVRHIEEQRSEHADGRIALVGHGDTIKSAIAFYLGMPLDLLQRIEIEPASVSTLVVGDWGARLLGLNERAGATVRPSLAELREQDGPPLARRNSA